MSDRQELEKLLHEDMFAREALDGLQSAQNKAATGPTISGINHRVRERSGVSQNKGLKLHWSAYAWAAGLLGLLLGIGFIMMNYLGQSRPRYSDEHASYRTKHF